MLGGMLAGCGGGGSISASTGVSSLVFTSEDAVVRGQGTAGGTAIPAAFDSNGAQLASIFSNFQVGGPYLSVFADGTATNPTAGTTYTDSSSPLNLNTDVAIVGDYTVIAEDSKVASIFAGTQAAALAVTDVTRVVNIGGTLLVCDLTHPSLTVYSPSDMSVGATLSLPSGTLFSGMLRLRALPNSSISSGSLAALYTHAIRIMTVSSSSVVSIANQTSISDTAIDFAVDDSYYYVLEQASSGAYSVHVLQQSDGTDLAQTPLSTATYPSYNAIGVAKSGSNRALFLGAGSSTSGTQNLVLQKAFLLS